MASQWSRVGTRMMPSPLARAPPANRHTARLRKCLSLIELHDVIARPGVRYHLIPGLKFPIGFRLMFEVTMHDKWLQSYRRKTRRPKIE
jgi:hypothetical protein